MKNILSSIIIVISTSILTFGAITYLFFSKGEITIGQSIQFQTEDGAFSFMLIPTKGRDVQMMEKAFEQFKEANPTYSNAILYRTTPINYFKIKKWANYKNRQEWQYPYLKS